MKRIAIVLIVFVFSSSICWAVEVAPRITDREIVERLTRLEEGQKAILREMNTRFESMDKRFESIDKRFESIDRRFESVDNRFESIDKRFESVDKRFDSIDKRFGSVDKRFDSIDKRFDSIHKRFDSIDKRFDSIDKRFDQMFNVLIAIISAFAGIVAVTIGFAIWDRRTMIRPFETTVKVMEEKIEDIRVKVQSFDEDKLSRLIGAMRKFAKNNKEIAEALKSFNLL